ncbi:hypothetical protein KSP40_PGU000021 [Platanthera guangdongensis]|uniref:Uncharacterized protein n=1 Tax=Platanthera guangdongensis TaxID=2320717 RepID=A0ABR2LT45_9ASPA
MRVSISTVCLFLLTGARKVSLTVSKIKANAGVTGHSQQWRRWREFINQDKKVDLFVGVASSSPRQDEKGCHGSYVDVFDFVQKNGFTFEAAYPYMTKDGKCTVKIKLILISKDA